MIVRLTSKQLDSLREAAMKSFPVEACALLFGKTIGDEAFVTKVVVAPNVLKSAVRFEIDPQTVFNAFEKADEEGLQFIGLFHSHPAPAAPSGIDRRFMRLWGDAVWLILSSTNGDLEAFQMINDETRQVSIKVENGK